jgi:NAD(P)H dehydrogenase (quinone)
LTALNNTFYHWGSIIVPPGYTDPIQFQSGTPYGTSFISNNGALDPDETALAAARYQAKRLVDLTAQFLAGKSTA